MMKRKLN